ncbi:MAG: hypothetical protein M3Q45_01900 [Chloroflexota bacterium]|nr:hypothetical protein [Chloroflexota bacterium]
MILIVTLTVRSAALEQFRTFEKRAAAVMQKHGGRIERTIAISAADDAEFVQEVHIVTFPNQGALLAYQNDQDMVAVAGLRQASVVKTEMLVGEAGPDYYQN